MVHKTEQNCKPLRFVHCGSIPDNKNAGRCGQKKKADLKRNRLLVDTKGVEPSASAMRMQRSPNWATRPLSIILSSFDDFIKSNCSFFNCPSIAKKFCFSNKWNRSLWLTMKSKAKPLMKSKPYRFDEIKSTHRRSDIIRTKWGYHIAMQYFIRPQVDFIEKSTPKRAFFWSTRRDSPLVIEQSTGLFSRILSAVGFKIRNLVSRPLS